MASTLGTPPVLRAVSDPTTSYVEPTIHIKTADFPRVAVQFAFTKTDGTSFQWYYEWSEDGTTWYRTANIATSAGTSTATAQEYTFVAATANLTELLWVAGNFFRVYVKRTGGAATNTVGIKATRLRVAGAF